MVSGTRKKRIGHSINKLNDILLHRSSWLPSSGRWVLRQRERSLRGIGNSSKEFEVSVQDDRGRRGTYWVSFECCMKYWHDSSPIQVEANSWPWHVVVLTKSQRSCAGALVREDAIADKILIRSSWQTAFGWNSMTKHYTAVPGPEWRHWSQSSSKSVSYITSSFSDWKAMGVDNRNVYICWRRG